MWVVSFCPKSEAAPSSGYAGLDFQQPPDIGSALSSSQAIVFWGGLHHNVKEVCTRSPYVGSARLVAVGVDSTDIHWRCPAWLPCMCNTSLPAASQAMERHGLALERKPEVARVIMDDVAPALRMLRHQVSPDLSQAHMNSTTAPFGGAQPVRR